jgi:REP element-mobilizing transposase RayT
MSDPLAYFLSWTTYGTWLPGDERGWVESGKFEIQPPDPSRREEAADRMSEDAVILTLEQRRIVKETVQRHCEIRKWPLHAVNPRSNHVHVIVTATIKPEDVLSQLKAWCSRRLSKHAGLVTRAGRRSKNGLKRWWTEHGSTKYINDEEYFRNAVRYVLERQ